MASGNDVWVARNDKRNIFRNEKFENLTLGDFPQVGLDPDSSKTVEYIDDVWLRGKRIVSAFEVEHSTPVYSGILRLTDLKVLQPNIVFPLFVVAPEKRKAKVFQELKRPAFSNEYIRMDEAVRFISYEKVREISGQYIDKSLPPPENVFDAMAEEVL